MCNQKATSPETLSILDQGMKLETSKFVVSWLRAITNENFIVLKWLWATFNEIFIPKFNDYLSFIYMKFKSSKPMGPSTRASPIKCLII